MSSTGKVSPKKQGKHTSWIQGYRLLTWLYKIFSNYFSCGHCHKVATLEELYNEEQLDIVDIFGHKPCKLLGSNRKLNMVWVCSNCIAGCDGGCAFPETREKPKVDELVYYMPPESDPRNMGGASDTCLNKVIDNICQWLLFYSCTL